ncbi:transmembrane protein [Tieghemostelium lacteum]|uniref:Transmembrane protein n=1 Tax=Tieghemostelium lacteum TaxID=361077 RepID=A0A151Z2U4_TIELA|nr:transmembrane protein [Tieghemostelium lacteum]|eukprot:KYQ88247.1 transmembrane protein [Tieghemostelium lacteum]
MSGSYENIENEDENIQDQIVMTPTFSSPDSQSLLLDKEDRDRLDLLDDLEDNNEQNNYNDENDTEIQQQQSLEPIKAIKQQKQKKSTIDDIKEETSKYLKSIIYGGMDGLVSIFVSIAVVASGDAKITVLLVVVLSKLIAGAISMGMGDYLGTQADVDFAKGERKREAWEVEYYIEGEKKEMVEIYLERGLPIDVATEVVDILAKNPKGFVDIMMVEELGIMPDTESEVAWKNGLVNFCSFLVFGIIPLLPYLAFLAVASAYGLSTQENLGTFISVIAISIITLFLMGVFKAKLTDTVWWKNGITTVIFGCLGAVVGFLTVEIIKKIFPDVDISG